jgi:formylglycine-generating enzyme required for sulfatase activity
MRSTLRSTWMVGLAVMFAGCLLPEYSVDENLGAAGAGGSLPELPPPPANCGGNFTGGPTMVPVRGGYCIDSTEVTWRQYMKWAAGIMATPAELANQPTECVSWNMDVMPPPTQECAEPIGQDNDLQPVVCVDWCDAHMFCESVGKRLCGRISGEELLTKDYADPGLSQWDNACTSGGRNDYPYSGPYQPNTCFAIGTGTGQPVAVGTKPGCQPSDPGYAGVFDLSGNVAEWENACTSSSGPGDRCLARGGSFADTKDGAACSTNSPVVRDIKINTIGFRCCWDPPT